MNKKQVPIYPSLISADILNLQNVLKTFDPHVHGYHIDIMDDHFVPNLTWGPMFVNAISKATQKILFVHLMVKKPETWLPRLQLKAGDTLAFHIENKVDHKKLIKQIKENKLQACIVINPKTPLEKIFHLANVIDQVLLMSVEPGFSGQSFFDSSIGRLKSLIELRTQHNLDFTIIMDGGINEKNIGELVRDGVDQVACAAAIFGHGNPIKNLENLQRIVKENL